MSEELAEPAFERCTEFWESCARLLAAYPNRPTTMSGDAEVKQLERQLKSLAEEMLPMLCENEFWIVDASVGKGNWASVPWVGIFDSRESTSAQRGVYPVIHFSTSEPIGIRVGLGVSATEFKSEADEKAAEVSNEFSAEEHEKLVQANLLDVVAGEGSRVEIGSGNLAKKYARGMIFERFAPLDELKSTPLELTLSLSIRTVSSRCTSVRSSNPPG